VANDLVDDVWFRVMTVSSRPLDDVDRRMLGILVDYGRMSVNELAIRAGVSRATAYARYDRLVADGVISRFRADVNPQAIGLDVAAMILINVQQGAWPITRDKVGRLPGVEYVAMTSGEFDFVLLVRAPDIAALRDVVLHRLQSMPEVRSTHTIFVLDEERHPIGVGAPPRADQPRGAHSPTTAAVIMVPLPAATYGLNTEISVTVVSTQLGTRP
jgi:DNA-binding Lrp family transcriptional regulator